MTDQTLCGQDLVGVGKLRGLLELLIGNLLALLARKGLLLSLLTLAAHTPGLVLVLLVGATGLEVGILNSADGSILFLLLVAQLGALIAQSVQVLEDTILLGLDGIELLLDLGVLVAQGLGLGVVEGLAQFGDLCLDVVDALLCLIQTGEALALLAQVGDLGESLALIHQTEGTSVDLLLKTGDFLVDLLDTLE